MTGGAGFIGSHVVKELLDAKHQVTVLDNLSTGYLKNLEPFQGLSLFEFVQGSILDCKLVESLVCESAAVIHLAASVGNKKSIEYPQDDLMANGLGVIHILQAMRKHGRKKIVFSSSAGIFGEPQYNPVDERHPNYPDSPYGCSKLYGERVILAYNKLYDFQGVCLRYFNAYGPNQRFDAYGNVIPIFVNNALSNLPLKIFGDGLQTRDFVHVSDIARINVRCAEDSSLRGAFNVGTGFEITIKDLACKIVELAGSQSLIEYGPKRPGDVSQCTAQIEKLKSALHLTPTPINDALLADYIRWMRADRQ